MNFQKINQNNLFLIEEIIVFFIQLQLLRERVRVNFPSIFNETALH